VSLFFSNKNRHEEIIAWTGFLIGCMQWSQSNALLFSKGCGFFHSAYVISSILNQPYKACFAFILLKNFDAMFHPSDLAV